MGLLDRILGRSKKPAPLPMPGRPAAPREDAPGPAMQTGGGGALFSLGGDAGATEAPPRRKVVRAPRIVDETRPDAEDPGASEGIAIKAQPSGDGRECKFMLSRPVLEGRSWWFASVDEAGGSPLAEQLFATGTLETVLVDDTTVTVSHVEPGPGDWLPLAQEIGALLRAHLEEERPALSDELLARIPDEAELREQIQQVIDLEVNPGVAAHSGHISLTRVRGNSVYIEMGGGCQGCSAADVTLKEGIHRSFRDAVPGVGAIYDETDHAAGDNPYFR